MHFPELDQTPEIDAVQCLNIHTHLASLLSLKTECFAVSAQVHFTAVAVLIREKGLPIDPRRLAIPNARAAARQS